MRHAYFVPARGHGLDLSEPEKNPGAQVDKLRRKLALTSIGFLL